MKKLIFSTLFSLIAILGLQAQDETIFTHYYLNHFITNPAVAGFNNAHEISLNLRNDWTGFTGSPKNYAVNYNGPVGNVFGLGLSVMSESVASFTKLRIEASYAFRFNLNALQLTTGFSTNYQSNSIPNSTLTNPLYDTGDVVLEDAVEGIQKFDAAFGVYGRINDATFFGLSTPNLITTRLDNSGAPEESSGLFEHVTIFGGHKFVLDGSDISLEPSVLISKVKDTPTLIDFNLKMTFLDEKLTGGVSYRSGTGGSLGLLLGTKINVVDLYYSYNMFMDTFSNYSNGSHEVTLGIKLPSKSTGKIKNTDSEAAMSKTYRR